MQETDLDIGEGERLAIERQHESLARNLGSTVCNALRDPKVVEVMLNSDGRIWIEAFGKGMFDSGERLLRSQAEKVIASVASALGGGATRDNPIVEGELPLDGSRFEGLITPVVESPVFAIRKPASKVFTLLDYAAQGVLSSMEDPLNKKAAVLKTFADECAGLTHIEILHKAVLQKKNMFVFGGTGSGKTTFTNAVIDAMATLTKDRLVLIEDTKEIQCNAENAVILRSSETVNISRLLRATLRLRPDRIIVGEVRGPEVLGLIKAWNTGHPGGIATAHADSCREGLLRIEQMIQEAGVPVNPRVIASVCHLVIFIDKERELAAGRKVREIALVTGYDPVKQEYLLQYI